MTEGENAKVGRFGYFPEWDELDGSIIDAGPAEGLGWRGQPEEVRAADLSAGRCFLKDKGYPKQ